jgi:hypothetical protein
VKLNSLREINAARKIKHQYRAHLRRMYGHATHYSSYAKLRLHTKAATQINKVARGRLARRQAQTERFLRVIKSAHKLLLKYALRFGANAVRVFWYEREEEVEFIFRDYIGLCERMGYIPPRLVVERNIAELANRILARQRTLAILIQRLWRGVMARRIVKYFKREVVRLRQHSWAKVLRVQRLYRGHAVRLKIRGIVLTKANLRIMEEYLNERRRKTVKEDKQARSQRALSTYIAERAVERTTRFTQRLEFAGPENEYKKMAVFASSCYCDDVAQRRAEELVALESEQINEDIDAAAAEVARKVYIRNKVSENGPDGYGQRGYKPTHAVRVVRGFAMGPELLSSRSRGYKGYFNQEMRSLMDKTIERASHDFTNKNLLSRFKEYNTHRRTKFIDDKNEEDGIEGASSNIGTLMLENSSLSLSSSASLARLPPIPQNSSSNSLHSLTSLSSAGSMGSMGSSNSINNINSLNNSGVAGGNGHVSIANQLATFNRGRKHAHAHIHDHNKVGPVRPFREYKYPAHIYHNNMEFLESDEDIRLAAKRNFSQKSV